MKEYGITEYHVQAASRNKSRRRFYRFGGGLIWTDSYNGYNGMYGSHAGAWIPPEKLKYPFKR